ncbi:MAG: flagellar basal body-associated FliL family protein [Planktotalea sp.]|uniref:flagellar basal body-associated FliL family protein n=1 Tax=Planktotalea sp. TaxID=2029877 RepID=UPI003C71B3F9
MIKKLLPIVLILIFGGAGIAAGLILKPEPKEAHAELGPCGDDPNAAGKTAKKDTHEADKPEAPEDVSFDYVKLNNQFIVPVIKNDTVRSIAIVALSLEVKLGTSDQVYAIEPKLRDTFLQALFDHASLGGFDGAFATTENLIRIRRSLKEQAVNVLGDIVNDVLITDIARQDN